MFWQCELVEQPVRDVPYFSETILVEWVPEKFARVGQLVSIKGRIWQVRSIHQSDPEPRSAHMKRQHEGRGKTVIDEW